MTSLTCAMKFLYLCRGFITSLLDDYLLLSLRTVFKIRSHCEGNDKIDEVFLSSIAIMQWILHQIVTATANGKMGIMATGDGIYTVIATENINDLFFSCCGSVN